MKTLCVFCGSSAGSDPVFAQAAAEVGRHFARTGRTLVYGGGCVGLMGTMADAALQAGGRVIGVIPRSLLEKEVGHLDVELRVVDSMHERKALMADLSEGFIALPGGIGTLEELFETWTWGQLGLHGKPLGLLDVNGFFAPLLQFVDGLVAQRFLRPVHREMLIVDRDIEALLARMAAYRPPPTPKWIEKRER